MNYVIENNHLKVTISNRGAELQSILGKTTNFEYLWQADKEFWGDKAVNIFPICGRLFGGKYTYKGKSYSLPCHGFAKDSLFDVKYSSADKIVFTLLSNENTKEVYPFDFKFSIEYSLDGAKLKTKFVVENTGKDTLPFSLGGHPGFNVPLENGVEFNEHYLEFSENASPQSLIITPDGFYNGTKDYSLVDGKIINLSHELFNIDGIFLTNMAKSVTLKTNKSNRFVKVSFPNMKFVGFWHTAKKPAPFICIEPWAGIPSTHGVIDDFDCKAEFKYLKSGETYDNFFDIEVNE